MRLEGCLYPLYEEAPLIKNNIAQTYYNLGRDDDEYRTRYELFQNYNPESEWYAHIVNSEIPDRLKFEQDYYNAVYKKVYTSILTNYLPKRDTRVRPNKKMLFIKM